MKKLSNSELQILQTLFTLEQKDLKRVLYTYLKKEYSDIKNTPAYIYAKGDIPIALVAHMDTVFSELPKLNDIYYDEHKNVMWSPLGLGADDRAGVFAILKILLNTNLKPTIILTTDEEMGGIGALKLISDITSPLSPMNFMIELDRRGNIDCVFYNEETEEFVNFIESFGFKEAFGTFSDISIISPAWKVSSVNLSIGYYNEHSKNEFLNITEMLLTIEKVINILSLKSIPTFEFKEGGLKSLSSDFISLDDVDMFDITSCDNCGAYAYKYETLDAYFLDEGNLIKVVVCEDCIGELVEWCPHCGQPFIAPSEYNLDFCPICKEELNV